MRSRMDTQTHAGGHPNLYDLNLCRGPVMQYTDVCTDFDVDTESIFLSEHGQTHRQTHRQSQMAFGCINVQGSGIGSTLFIMFAHDLKPLDTFSYLLKYANNT